MDTASVAAARGRSFAPLGQPRCRLAQRAPSRKSDRLLANELRDPGGYDWRLCRMAMVRAPARTVLPASYRKPAGADSVRGQRVTGYAQSTVLRLGGHARRHRQE